MPVSPNWNVDGPVRVQVRNNGTALPESAALVSLIVHHAAQAASRATLVFADGDPLSTGFPLFDSVDLEPGASLEVEAGYGDTASVLFSGIVVSHGLRIDGDSPPRTVLDCKGTVSAGESEWTDTITLRVAYGDNLMTLDAQIDGRHQPYGRMRFQGSPLAFVGCLVKLGGLGARFRDAVRASAITHDISQGGWTTELAFGATSEPAIGLADGRGNSIRFDATGITMESTRDIRIVAKGSTTVSAEGPTAVTGALVMIN